MLLTVYQEKAKFDILEKLIKDSALLHLDWSMKLIGTANHEDQTLWFSKCDIPWHITVAILCGKNDAYEKYRYVQYMYLIRILKILKQ